MVNTLTIRSLDELISFVPHTLGFTPERSLVCLAFGAGPTARVDLPESADELAGFLAQLSEVYVDRYHPPRVALLGYSPDRDTCTAAVQAVAAAFGAAEGGPVASPLLWVDGDRWYDLIEGVAGVVDPSARARLGAEFALLGKPMPTGGREDLAAGLIGDPAEVARVAVHLGAATARVGEMSSEQRRHEARWLGTRVDEFLRARTFLPDADTARVLAIIKDVGARDAVESRMTRANAPVLSDFWRDLVRRAPDGARDTPAAMLALSCYLDGAGAQAWTALDQLAQPHPLAELVETALQRAIHPDKVEHLLRTSLDGAVLQQAVLRSPAGQQPGREAQRQADRHLRGVDPYDPGRPAPGHGQGR